jgi:hypothetical protein
VEWAAFGVPSTERGSPILPSKESDMSEKEQEFMEFLAQLLYTADETTDVSFEADPGYIYVRMVGGKEMIIRVEDCAD